MTELHRRLPGDSPDVDTVLGPGDLITAVDLPPLAIARVSAYRKAGDRASHSFAVGAVAAALDVRDGVVHDVRLALGGVAHKPWRAYAEENALRGRPATRETLLARPIPSSRLPNPCGTTPTRSR